jgi:hypothetical protein
MKFQEFTPLSKKKMLQSDNQNLLAPHYFQFDRIRQKNLQKN